MSVRVSVIGASGYTGGELLRILQNHGEAEIVGTYGKTTAGKTVSSLHPGLRGIMDSTIERPDYEEVGEKSDLVFTATPHGVAMSYVPELLDAGTRVVDLSADYRIDDIAIFEKYYEEHESPEVYAVYGLPEINREEIENSELVANPGCYPTAAVLSLAPLLRKEMVELSPIIVDSKSGTSGAGAKPSERLHHPTCTDNLMGYNLVGHRHSPEIKQEAEKLAKAEVETHFTPHLVPMIRGILNTSHLFLKEERELDELLDIYRNFYDGKPFVRVIDELPQTNAVRGSNFCDIGIRNSEENRRVVVVSAIDNLVKGASGQAIQNMNIMFGLDESEGLRTVPLRP